MEYFTEVCYLGCNMSKGSIDSSNGNILTSSYVFCDRGFESKLYIDSQCFGSRQLVFD